MPTRTLVRWAIGTAVLTAALSATNLVPLPLDVRLAIVASCDTIASLATVAIIRKRPPLPRAVRKTLAMLAATALAFALILVLLFTETKHAARADVDEVGLRLVEFVALGGVLWLAGLTISFRRTRRLPI